MNPVHQLWIDLSLQDNAQLKGTGSCSAWSSGATRPAPANIPTPNVLFNEYKKLAVVKAEQVSWFPSIEFFKSYKHCSDVLVSKPLSVCRCLNNSSFSKSCGRFRSTNILHKHNCGIWLSSLWGCSDQFGFVHKLQRVRKIFPSTIDCRMMWFLCFKNNSVTNILK